MKAEAHPATAGFPESKELAIPSETGAALATVAAQLFQANLAEIGITLKIDRIDLPTFTELFYGDDPLGERSNLYF